MDLEFAESVEFVGRIMEGAGVAIIVIGAALATIVFLGRLRRAGEFDGVYDAYRRSVGRAILRGLEFLVAGDIIRTVAIEPTFRGVGILAIIVAIRTFLSLELNWRLRAGGHGSSGRPAAMLRGEADADGVNGSLDCR